MEFAFAIAIMSLSSRTCTVVHTEEQLCQPVWRTVKATSPVTGPLTAGRWVFTAIPSTGGATSRSATLTLVATNDTVDENNVMKSIGSQLQLVVKFVGSNRSDTLSLTITG